MKPMCRKSFLIAVISAALIFTSGVLKVPAQEEKPEKSIPFDQKMADLLVARPLTAAGTVVGAGVFIVTLPISIFTGNVKNVFRDTVVRPTKYTFTRPLGRMEEERE